MKSNKKLIIIYASSKNGVIGDSNKLPWKMKDDLSFFQKQTVGNTCLMGRKTWESLPEGGLKDRKNIVLSTQKKYDLPKGVDLINSFLEIRESNIEGDLYIIGGATTYKIFENMADEFIVTEIDAKIDGDTHYVPNLTNWHPETLMKIEKNSDNEFSAVIKRYTKK